MSAPTLPTVDQAESRETDGLTRLVKALDKIEPWMVLVVVLVLIFVLRRGGGGHGTGYR